MLPLCRIPPQETLQAGGRHFEWRRQGGDPGRPRLPRGSHGTAQIWRNSLGGPIIKPLLGKAAVPDDSPYTTGGIGLLGTAPSQDALQECDTLLIAGSSFPYMEFYPKAGLRLNAFRSTSIRRESDCGIRPTLAWSATASECSPLLLPLSEAKAGPEVFWRKRRSAWRPGTS